MDCKTIAQKAPTGCVSQGFESPWGRWFLTPAVITPVLSLVGTNMYQSNQGLVFIYNCDSRICVFLSCF